MRQPLTIRPIQVEDITSKFKMGQADLQPLKSFLQDEAVIAQQESISVTYVAVDELKRVWGCYVSLVCSVKWLWMIVIPLRGMRELIVIKHHYQRLKLHV